MEPMETKNERRTENKKTLWEMEVSWGEGKHERREPISGYGLRDEIAAIMSKNPRKITLRQVEVTDTRTWKPVKD